MLGDYIEEYKKALQNNDKKEQVRIEKALQSLGMDKYTLMVLVKEL